MRKHTPGPWFVNGHERYTKYVEARIDGGLIQEVAACGPTEKPEQQEANARLCAAAPELLEALQGMLEVYGGQYNDDCLPKSSTELELIQQARAAIAKATA
ncbi:hypothetical protein ACOANU_29155 [Pseudomonas aeruginosa]|uniref:hypothetical protein n=1 Tax=Pseudomonas aeruginosa TaxID=287 RepID=UPI000BB85C04|nr:hypothetical protein [Pseudomonas aeruginosa]EKJ8513839.1 hypothetical protein [Pseudomonas aeruginosa]ELK7310577.1 hypothetical protein [Pseudomonas aeruginosa]ELP0277596.1 hypothetical protein [Pseudomonas aeruginosa]PBX56892.1 hypothetical protein CJT77_31260 [Pseudomonas aeruginosa]HBP0520662.1 hypothetical protein [Pseudomonas aeruginosa]